MMIAYILMFAVGLALLIKGSEYVTLYASRLAKLLGVSETVIGLTVVSLSTSLPELSVSLLSIFFGSSEIPTGTIVGSNIANVCLILGLSAVFSVIKTNKELFRKSLYTLFFTILVSLFLIGKMGFYEGGLIVILFCCYIFMVVRNKGNPGGGIDGVTEEDGGKYRNLALSLLGGLIVVVGAEMLIESTINMAHVMGISELFISFIAIAIGTSLPELAVSFTAAVKKMEGISIGNILGSNVFNIFILSLVAVFAGIPSNVAIIFKGLPVLVLSALLLTLFIRRKWEITTAEGTLLLALYTVFILLQFI